MNYKHIILYHFITLYLLLSPVFGQNITGTFPDLANQQIKLFGFNGFDTYAIDSTQANENEEFELAYCKTDYGMGYVSGADNKPFAA